MKISNRERSIFEHIAARYNCLREIRYNDPYNNVADIIQAIETYNRSIIWRTFEYISLAIQSIIYIFFGSIDNMSIGRYQLKVSHILSANSVKFTLSERKISFPQNRLPPMLLIFKSRNDRSILFWLMKLPKFNFLIKDIIDIDKLKYFIEEYSRTMPSDTGFTYWYVASELFRIGNGIPK